MTYQQIVSLGVRPFFVIAHATTLKWVYVAFFSATIKLCLHLIDDRYKTSVCRNVYTTS